MKPFVLQPSGAKPNADGSKTGESELLAQELVDHDFEVPENWSEGDYEYASE